MTNERAETMSYEIQIEMILEGGWDAEEVVIATMAPTIEITSQDDEETLMDKVYEHINAWYEKTGNVGCEPQYDLDEALTIAERM